MQEFKQMNECAEELCVSIKEMKVVQVHLEVNNWLNKEVALQAELRMQLKKRGMNTILLLMICTNA